MKVMMRAFFSKLASTGVSVRSFATTPLVRLPSDMPRPLEGHVALVTGASRGIGRGIALQLGQAGATVYITGRKPESSYSKEEPTLPALEKTAEDIRSRGGEAVPVFCDHSNPDDVEKLFQQIQEENEGVLDILVNNAYSAVADFRKIGGRSFFELDPLFWDSVNNVGLRNHYICSVYAARLMTKRKSGLIVNISSAGGLQYIFNVPYGVGKCALDRLSTDMAIELKPHNVAVISLWPGVVKTEITSIMEKKGEISEFTKMDEKLVEKQMLTAESTEFAGKAIVALASDRKIMKKSGQIILTSDAAREYGFQDVDGSTPGDMRQLKGSLEFLGYPTVAQYVPGWLRVPLWAMHFASYKFQFKFF